MPEPAETTTVPVSLWSLSAEDGPVEIEYEGAASRVMVQRTDDDEVALHILPPPGNGDESEAALTVYVTVAEAERLGMALVRKAAPDAR